MRRRFSVASGLALLLLGAVTPTVAGWADTEPLGSDRPHWRRNLFRRVLSDQKYLATTWAPEQVRRQDVVLRARGAARPPAR